jgi:hypothetical protein
MATVTDLPQGGAIFHDLDNDALARVAIHKPGALVGEWSILDHRERSTNGSRRSCLVLPMG